MYYESWQSGFEDVLKRGFPKPIDPHAVLVELRTPQVSDFIHGSTSAVPFVVSARVRELLDSEQLTGFEYTPAIVAKVATKGRSKRHSTRGEPEDSILKSRGTDLAQAPALYAVRVTGYTEVVPDFESGRSPAGAVSPFRRIDSAETPDLWRPRYKGAPFSAWGFCSERFRQLCERHSLSNIKFQSFDLFMAEFRKDLSKR